MMDSLIEGVVLFGYFILFGAFVRFVVVRRKAPVWWLALLTPVVAGAVLVPLSGLIESLFGKIPDPSPSIAWFLLGGIFACYRIVADTYVRPNDTTKPIAQEPKSEPSESIAPTPPPQKLDPSLEKSSPSRYNLRTIVLAILLCAAVLCLTFPFASKRYSDARTPDGLHFFFPVLFASRHQNEFGYYFVYEIDWSRTIHGFLWLSSVSVGLTWLGHAVRNNHKGKRL